MCLQRNCQLDASDSSKMGDLTMMPQICSTLLDEIEDSFHRHSRSADRWKASLTTTLGVWERDSVKCWIYKARQRCRWKFVAVAAITGHYTMLEIFKDVIQGLMATGEKWWPDIEWIRFFMLYFFLNKYVMNCYVLLLHFRSAAGSRFVNWTTGFRDFIFLLRCSIYKPNSEQDMRLVLDLCL